MPELRQSVDADVNRSECAIHASDVTNPILRHCPEAAPNVNLRRAFPVPLRSEAGRLAAGRGSG